MAEREGRWGLELGVQNLEYRKGWPRNSPETRRRMERKVREERDKRKREENGEKRNAVAAMEMDLRIHDGGGGGGLVVRERVWELNGRRRLSRRYVILKIYFLSFSCLGGSTLL